MRPVVVFGGSGMVGRALAEAAPARVVALSRAEADILDPQAVAAALDRLDPAGIVNAAARTDVDGQESDRDGAFATNATAAGALAEACAARGVPLVHLSTDFVFDGRKHGAYREDDTPNPLSVYGASKLAGERAVLAAHPAALVVRVAWTFGATGANFVPTMLRLARRHGALRATVDQRGCPTSAAGIARACLALLDRLRDGAPGGLLHWCGAPAVSRADFARAIVQAAGLDVAVADAVAADFPTPAARPANGALDCSRARTAYGLEPDDWRAVLPGVVAAILREGEGKA